MTNTNTFCLISISNLKTRRFETRRFETWRFVNLTFCKPDVLKPDVLKPDVLKPDVLKPDVLWVYPADTWKWTWRQKFLYMFPLLPKGDQTKLLKFFWLKIFSICHCCRWHWWQTYSCEYLHQFSKKFETVLMEYSGAGGKLIHEKNQKQKISWHCPFKLKEQI